MHAALVKYAIIMLTLCALSLGQSAAAGETLAGRYKMSGGPDVASELLLAPDGRFTYFLAAGALDEHASGQWRVDGTRLRLTTIPKPVAPTFAVGAITRSAQGIPTFHVVAPAGSGIAGVSLRLGYDTGEIVEGYTQETGWSLPRYDPQKSPRWVEFAIPMYNLQSQRFPLDLAKGDDFTFAITPNDIGTVDFTDLPIAIEQGQIVIQRGEGSMIFEAIKP